MELRPATADDIEAVTAFAIEGMRAELYPGLRLAPQKVRGVVSDMVQSRGGFQMAAFSGGRLVGAIAAVVSELAFFERCEAHVILCRATLPGAGAALMRKLKAWAVADMRIRRVQFPQEFHADPRALKLLARLGFNQQITVCVFNKV